MGLVFAEVDTESVVAVLVAAAGWDSMSDSPAAALVAELYLPLSRSNNRHY